MKKYYLVLFTFLLFNACNKNTVDWYQGNLDDALTNVNKKIIFIEPGRQFDWSTSDIEKKLRPGYVCKTFDDLLGATSDYIIKDEFVKQRAEFNDRVYYNKEINAYSKLRTSILKHIAKQ